MLAGDWRRVLHLVAEAAAGIGPGTATSHRLADHGAMTTRLPLAAGAQVRIVAHQLLGSRRHDLAS